MFSSLSFLIFHPSHVSVLETIFRNMSRMKDQKGERKKHSISHSEWSWLTFCNIANVTDQDEPNQTHKADCHVYSVWLMWGVTGVNVSCPLQPLLRSKFVIWRLTIMSHNEYSCYWHNRCCKIAFKVICCTVCMGITDFSRKFYSFCCFQVIVL
jgi:hypothetical protein